MFCSNIVEVVFHLTLWFPIDWPEDAGVGFDIEISFSLHKTFLSEADGTERSSLSRRVAPLHSLETLKAVGLTWAIH